LEGELSHYGRELIAKLLSEGRVSRPIDLKLKRSDLGKELLEFLVAVSAASIR
jgi:hypothetical protein